MMRLAHGWRLSAGVGISRALIREFIRPAIRAIPSEMAHQLGACRVFLVSELGGPRVASRWATTGPGVEITVATEGRDPHDIALELLICLGQALWENLTPDQAKAYWLLLDAELRDNIPGEIDEEAVREKRALLASAISAASRRRLTRYGRASFAATAAEYVHCLWHEVHVIRGREHLPAFEVRRRLELLARWFPPGREHPLYPKGEETSGG